MEENLDVKNVVRKQETTANSFITQASLHYNRVKGYSTESYDSNYLRELKRPYQPALGKGLSVEALTFEHTKLKDYLRIVTEELKIREDAPKRLLLMKTFIKLIDEDLKPPEIILESSNEGYGEDDTIYRAAPAAVASSSRGAFSALVAGSSSSSSRAGSSSSISSSNIATALAEDRML